MNDKTPADVAAGVLLSTSRLAFATLDVETRIDELPVGGAVPDWLEGALLRNGPAQFEVGLERYRHWFDGLAMLHRFGFAGGNVSYANKFLRSPGWLEARRTNRIARAEFATDPRVSIVERVRQMFGAASSDNANVNVVPYGDGYLALTETPAPVAFDGESLDTRGVLRYDDDVRGQVTTAHTHDDAARGATFNLVVEFGRRCRYHVVRIDHGTLRRAIVGSVAVDRPAYVHSFSTTDRYVVICEYPLVVRPLDLMLHRKPYIENYFWDPSRAATFHVVDKDGGGRIASYEAPAFFAFHHVNAFEDGDAIAVDVCAYEDASIVDRLMLDALRDPHAPPLPQAALRRYRLVPGRTGAQLEELWPDTVDLPRVAPARRSSPYRFAYGVGVCAQRPREFINQLLKVDLERRSAAVWTSPGAFPGEPVFVPRPGARDEDDGVVLSVVLDGPAGTSYLLVLDARSLGELARAHVPHHIPYGFHGIFR